MNDRDDLGELIGSVRNVIKSSSLYFYGRIRYGTKLDKLEERLLCLDAFRVYICSVKVPVKIESQFNIFTIKMIDRIVDCHIVIELNEKQTHSLFGLSEKSSFQPFLIMLIRNLHAVFPQPLNSIINFRPENEYDNLLRLSTEFGEETRTSVNTNLPCGGFSYRYECACDFHQMPYSRALQTLIDTVFSHRTSREFTFREMEALPQKEWQPVLTALRHNEWFKTLIIENTKLSTENIDELCHVLHSCKAITDVRLIDCNLRTDFCTKLAVYFPVMHFEHVDLSLNSIEDKGLNVLSSSLVNRKYPLKSINLRQCSVTHKSLINFHTGLVSNPVLLKNLKILNLTGNRIREENCLTILFSNPENVLEELHFSDVEFNLESFFHGLNKSFCKLRRLFVLSVKSTNPSTSPGSVKKFFSQVKHLEVLQLSNANLSNEFLRELCDGVHSNENLKSLDLRLNGNSLENFLREYASRFASIPCLVTLDVSSCDIDNEMSNLICELTKNHHLKTLYIGKNLNNIKNKNWPRFISVMREMIFENQLENLSLVDLKVKENSSDILLALLQNNSMKSIDIRGMMIGDQGVRALGRVLRTNRHLKTIYVDRNLLSLINFEDLVSAFDENFTVEYFPVPVMDIVQMKISEKERVEKLQQLLGKLDAISMRNQQKNEMIYPTESLISIPNAILSRDLKLSWDAQQQMIGHELSLEYSSTSRSPSKFDEVRSNSLRNERISKIGRKLTQIYLEEEENFRENFREFSKKFEEEFVERNERLSRKYYKLCREQFQLPPDDKFQEQIRSHIARSNQSMQQFLSEEFSARMLNHSRECFVDLATLLQKRAYDINYENSIELQKQLETLICPPTTNNNPSTLDRFVSGGTNILTRLTHRHTQPVSSEQVDDSNNHQVLKNFDVHEYLEENSSNRADRTTGALLGKSNQDAISSTSPRNETTAEEDEANQIEHELLDLVEREKRKDQNQSRPPPPAIPQKKRFSAIVPEEHFDLEIEAGNKLNHLAKDRPRRANVQPPVARRTINTGLNESLSDDGLDSEEPGSADVFTSPTANGEPPVTTDPPINESTERVVSRVTKIPLKPSKTLFNNSNTTTLHTSLKIQPSLPMLQNHPTAKVISNSLDTTETISPDPVSEFNQNKSSILKEEMNEFGSSPAPAAGNRTGRPPLGPRVLPTLDPSADSQPIRLRHVQPVKKESPAAAMENVSMSSMETSAETTEEYRSMSVKERARLLTNNRLSQQMPEKKMNTPPATNSSGS